jgi:hypothetical protein
MPRRGFAGSAVPTTTTAAVSAAAMSFDIASIEGWVFTTTPFVVVLSRGDRLVEEKILCSSLVGNTLIVAPDGRGYDDTQPRDHDPGSSVIHVLSSDVVDEANVHVHDPDRDDHPQYLKTASLPPPPAIAYLHQQLAPEAVWVIVHNLGFRPSVTIKDSASGIVIGDVVHLDANNLIVSFSSALGGEAYLS